MYTSEVNDLNHLLDFLKTPTPGSWLNAALKQLDLLLVDHAHCERKAAATALNFIAKYPTFSELVEKMSPLAREELLHFEKVISILKQKNIPFISIKPSSYAQVLHNEAACSKNLDKLRDQLIIGAIIEARSCERFAKLVPLLVDPKLAKFYKGLIKSEARHFEDYLNLAKQYGENVEERIAHFLSIENELILKADKVFRFHSGQPQ